MSSQTRATRKGVLPPTYLLAAMLVMVALHFALPLVRIVPLPWDLLGLLPAAAGVALNLIADGDFHRANTTVKPFEESAALLTDGVYRISRNPMYLGFALVLIGVAVLLGSLSPWIAVPAFVVAMDRVFIRAEERSLAQTFGPAWANYKQHVRRWL
jgi:protein-S-isoprenylcysteine O-methyltransferase Ste14